MTITRKGIEYIGKVPDVVVQAPIERLSDVQGRCKGCGNKIYCMDVETAICPICVGKQIKEEKNV